MTERTPAPRHLLALVLLLAACGGEEAGFRPAVPSGTPTCTATAALASTAGRCAEDLPATLERDLVPFWDPAVPMTWHALERADDWVTFVATDASKITVTPFGNGLSGPESLARRERLADGAVAGEAGVRGGVDRDGGFVRVDGRRVSVAEAVEGLSVRPDGTVIAAVATGSGEHAFVPVWPAPPADPLEVPTGLRACRQRLGFRRTGLAAWCEDEAGAPVLALGPGPADLRPISDVSCWATALAGSDDADVWALDGAGRVRHLVGGEWAAEPDEVTGVAIASRRAGRTAVLGPEGGWLLAGGCWSRLATGGPLPIGPGSEVAWLGDDVLVWVHEDVLGMLRLDARAP